MRIISVNLNGIRSAANKGFFKWLELQNADLVCLQEVRASDEQLADKIFHPKGHEAYYYCAQKKGYSGVGIYARQKPDRIIKGLGWDIADTEGRYIELCFGDLSVASVYLPSGSSGEERQNVKFAFLDKYMQILKDQIKHPRQYILCGDWNIAHKTLILKTGAVINKLLVSYQRSAHGLTNYSKKSDLSMHIDILIPIKSNILGGHNAHHMLGPIMLVGGSIIRSSALLWPIRLPSLMCILQKNFLIMPR